jgi:hypothetical protein
MITQQELKQRVHYDPLTGVFTWLPHPTNKALRNRDTDKEAGSISKRDKIFYRRISVNGKRYYAHHLAILYVDGYMPKEVDHDNGDGLDNRYSNLTPTTHKNNMRNMRYHADSQHGIVGVIYAKDRYKWRAHITVNYKLITLYEGSDFFEACCARKSAENKYNFHPNHGRRT